MSIENVVREFMYAARSLRRRPTFTLVAALSLALGIGASTAMFDVADAVLLAPLDLPRLDRLVEFSEEGPPFDASYPLYTDFRERVDDAIRLAAYTPPARASLSLDDRSRMIEGSYVSGNYFDVLGVAPLLGRTFNSQDEVHGAHPVAVITDALWRSGFGSDPSVIGRSIVLNRRSVEIVGVVPRGFRGTMLDRPADAWIALGGYETVAAGLDTEVVLATSNIHWLRLVGLLDDSVSLQQAQSVFSRAQTSLEAIHGWQIPEQPVLLEPVTVSAAGLRDRADTVRLVVLLVAAAGTLLLVGCGNVTQLLLARAREREKEIALRLALGSPRLPIVRQMLFESLLISLLGTIVGIGVAWGMLRALSSFELPGEIEIGALDLAPDVRLLAFAALAATVAGVISGLTPTMHTIRKDLQASLRLNARTGSYRVSRIRAMDSAVILQYALCVSLLAVGGLFAGSLQKMFSVDLGFEPRGVASVSVDLGLERYEPEEMLTLLAQSSEYARALPGNLAAAWAGNTPLESWTEQTIRFESSEGAAREPERIGYTLAWPGYFETLGTPLLRGRAFDERDGVGAELVAIVNATMAETHWPDRDAVGQRIGWGIRGPWMRVIGVAGDSKYSSVIETPEPHLYVAGPQHEEIYSVITLTLMARSTRPPIDALRDLERSVGRVDSRLPVFEATTLEAVVDKSLSSSRIAVVLLALFGVLSLVLAALGAYGAVAYAVSQRLHDIGIRLALGANRHDVVRFALERSLGGALAGIIVGLALSLWLNQLLASVLYDTPPLDLTTLALVGAVLVLVALVATYLPARRAGRVEPMLILKS